tara:strand:+ start:70 stop:1176 length:1107 start_codon:yes stop_codon:yes gene_type:complete
MGVIKKIVNNFINRPNFKKYWLNLKNKENLPSDLNSMINFFIETKSYNLTSKYWEYLNIKHTNYILKNKEKDYGTNIAQHYYTFTSFDENLSKSALENIKNDNLNLSVKLFKKHFNLNFSESINYNLITLVLYLNLKKLDAFDLINKLNDSGYLLFNSPFIEIDGIKITSDKINSLFDYEKINHFKDFKNVDRILEIGAGLGRTSQAILDLEKIKNYTICDIPPALYLSYQRLKSTFPEKQIKLLYEIDNTQDLIKNINSSDISFIMPHQLDLLNKYNFDLTIAVDCMHEMDKKTIIFYLNRINKISKFFYFSVWKNTTVPFSGVSNKLGNRLDYFKNDYPLPENWEKTFEEELVFPSNYICAGFKVI